MTFRTFGVDVDEPFQVLPPLSEDEFGALLEDIRVRGVQVPVVVDELGNVIDGHHRMRCAVLLGVECPKDVRSGLSEAEKRSLARSLNLQRRHLSFKQKRQVIGSELKENPDRSNNSIAKLLGVSDTTVESVRQELGLGSSVRRGADGKVYQRHKSSVRRFKAPEITPPFPWFGGKRRVAVPVWEGLGPVDNYVEPFAGSLAVLLGRPKQLHSHRIAETVNDADGFVANFWRATAVAAKEVAKWADYPVNENDLHARKKWLVENSVGLSERLESDPDWFDARIAGYWVWGLSMWIGSGWPARKSRQRPNLSSAGSGVFGARDVYEMFDELKVRLRDVRVCCGDWSRVVSPAALAHGKVKGVFLDPPYDLSMRDDKLYGTDSVGLSQAVREWCLEVGDDPSMRVVLAGYIDEHEDEIPDSWQRLFWTAGRAYGTSTNQVGRNEVNRDRECLWFSPHCLKVAINDR